jgi:hypothetical protein
MTGIKHASIKLSPYNAEHYVSGMHVDTVYVNNLNFFYANCGVYFLT